MTECNTNNTELKQFKWLMGIGAFVVFVTAISIWLAPYVFIEDTSAITRYMILKIPPMFIDVFILIASLVLFDFIGHEDSLCKIYESSIATSILYSALVLGVAIAIAFG